MAVYPSIGLYLFLAVKKPKLRSFTSLSKKMQSIRGVAATTSLAIPAESPNSEMTLLSNIDRVFNDIRGFWCKTTGTPWYKILLIRKTLLSRSKEVVENQLDHLLTTPTSF
jgi:hypothetical protein